MSHIDRKELKKDWERITHPAKERQKECVRTSVYDNKGKGRRERLFPDLHVRVFEREESEENNADRHTRLPDRALRKSLADTAFEMNRYLQPERRNGNELKTIHTKLSELDRILSKLSEDPGGLPAELQKLHESVRKKKKQLERIARKNAPVNPEALRSFEEVGAGIESVDAADWLVSDLLENVNGILTGQKSKTDGMNTEDLEKLVNEIDAMGSRHRSTKEQQSLGLMENEYLGDIIDHPNRIMQEASEIKKGSQVRREVGKHEESVELFENTKGKRERDALKEKHGLLSNITRANRNNIRQKMSKDGLEAVRGMMHNGKRTMGFSPLAAMGLGGNLYKGFSGVNYLMGMTPQAVEKNKKSAETRGIMNRYLGLDQLYRNFMTKNIDIRNRSAFLKRYGSEGSVRVMIRKEQDKATGKGSENRMNGFLMRKYAEELWKGAFLKEDGSVITERERQTEDSEKKQRRKLYADILRAMGFDIRYPTMDAGKPEIRAVDIYKRLLM